VCGEGPFCVKSGALLLYPLVTLLIWALARRLFDARIAFWSALAFLLLPGVSLSSLIISTDVRSSCSGRWRCMRIGAQSARTGGAGGCWPRRGRAGPAEPSTPW